MEIIYFLIIGAIIGWLAGLIMHGRGFGAVGNIALGILGAIIGGFLFRILGIEASSGFSTFIMALIGAIVVLGIVGMIKRA